MSWSGFLWNQVIKTGIFLFLVPIGHQLTTGQKQYGVDELETYLKIAKQVERVRCDRASLGEARAGHEGLAEEKTSLELALVKLQTLVRVSEEAEEEAEVRADGEMAKRSGVEKEEEIAALNNELAATRKLLADTAASRY